MATLEEFQDQITSTTSDYSGLVSDVVERTRPDIRQLTLEAYGDPTAANDPARYYDALRLSEEAIRRAMLQGLGHLIIEPLMTQTVGNVLYNEQPPEYRSKVHHPAVFTAELSRGRIHNNERGKFVRYADRKLRAFASLAFCTLGYTKQQDLAGTFRDVSQRVRDFSAQTLDHRLGKNWRELDPTAAAKLEITELDGRKLSRYDRRLLLTSQKPLDVQQSFSNATATAAEFTAIGIQALHRALFKAGCWESSVWYPYAFSHLGKLAFGAKLPFWSAQDFAIAANSPHPAPLFVARHHWPSKHYSIDYAQAAHKNYLAQKGTGACQGIIPPKRQFITAVGLTVRERFTETIRDKAKEAGDPLAIPDMPPASKITSADAASALALSIAYRGKYDL